ncbi:MAG: glycosyltransferase [Chitinivibrionales bacterium]|nr:glycosyltransferase [Chitinivibrionales bacterium]
MGAAGTSPGKVFMDKEVMPVVSIIVPSHRPEYMRKLAEKLISHKSEVSNEIIVVTDYPLELLKKVSSAIRWIYHNSTSISAKRNRGAAIAHGELLAFIDDDCEPAENWLDEATGFLRNHPEYAGVEGKTEIGNNLKADTSALREYKRLEKPGFRTNNIMYRKSVFMEVGGFDERFTVQREDIDLALTINKKGYTIGFCATMKIYHHIRLNEKWDLLKNCINRRFDPLLYKKHGALYRKQVGSPFTPGIACILILHILCIAGSVTVMRLLPVFLAGEIGGIVFFTVRRSGFRKVKIMNFLIDWVSFFISPFVLGAALAFGSVKFKKLLIF